MSRVLYERAAQVIEQRNPCTEGQLALIMDLLGFETRQHRRLGMACRKPGDHWGALPDFRNALDAEIWIGKHDRGGRFTVITQGPKCWIATYLTAHENNGEGWSISMGAAMWAAYVRARGASR
jgi:hypothetical protein